MSIEFLPLLQIQRDLYKEERGVGRFQTYLRTMIDSRTDDLKLPLVAMNPMGKDHVGALLDEWLELDADGVAAETLDAIAPEVCGLTGDFKVGLVISDDLHGKWTNRYSSEFGHRFRERALYKRGWIVCILWTSESPSLTALREEVRTAVYRAAIIQERGEARTLREMLDQESAAMVRAGCTGPSLDDDDMAYTGDVITQYLDTTDHPIVMACLFGDEAVKALGHAPLGLSHRAGLAWALRNARSTRRASMQ